VNLRERAAATVVSYATVRRRYEAGAYARVSSADQRTDLDRQVARVTTWATGRHLAVGRVVTEVGSALRWTLT
jgi:predicted site-specific integrase-resolvase